jgi:hypothetical protein
VQRSNPGNHVCSWLEADELDDATGRQQSGGTPVAMPTPRQRQPAARRLKGPLDGGHRDDEGKRCLCREMPPRFDKRGKGASGAIAIALGIVRASLWRAGSVMHDCENTLI